MSLLGQMLSFIHTVVTLVFIMRLFCLCLAQFQPWSRRIPTTHWRQKERRSRWAVRLTGRSPSWFGGRRRWRRKNSRTWSTKTCGGTRYRWRSVMRSSLPCRSHVLFVHSVFYAWPLLCSNFHSTDDMIFKSDSLAECLQLTASVTIHFHCLFPYSGYSLLIVSTKEVIQIWKMMIVK